MRFESTPNPNAVKCVLPYPRTGPIVSCFKPEDAAADPLAASLLAIEGVTHVLLHTEFVSVCKAPGSSWGPIKKNIRAALADA